MTQTKAEMKVMCAIIDVQLELDRACRKHEPFNSPHEGYAVILEELEELWFEVRKSEHDQERMKKEACQVAAMAVRFMIDLCPFDQISEEAQIIMDGSNHTVEQYFDEKISKMKGN